MDNNDLYPLIDKYLAGMANPAERAILEAYYTRLHSEGYSIKIPEKEIMAELLERIRHEIGDDNSHAIPMRLSSWKRSAAIAAAVLAIMAGIWWYTHQKPANREIAVVNPMTRQNHNAATLTLSDGQQLALDTVSGDINTAGSARLVNANGVLSYHSSSSADDVRFNTVTTSRGNQYQVLLPDGSRVMLNASSSLSFPTAFTGNTRQVTLLKGEAYFEIAANTKQPFLVKTGGQEVEVLGTRFNIQNYPEEGPASTTLVQGAVRIKENGENVLLKPGEQTSMANGRFRISHPDMNSVLAWTGGFFEFSNLPLQTIMRQLSRWYDVDIVYEGAVTGKKFGGRISKQLPLPRVLQMLESNGIRFQRKGNTLTVKTYDMK